MNQKQSSRYEDFNVAPQLKKYGILRSKIETFSFDGAEQRWEFIINSIVLHKQLMDREIDLSVCLSDCLSIFLSIQLASQPATQLSIDTAVQELFCLDLIINTHKKITGLKKRYIPCLNNTLDHTECFSLHEFVTYKCFRRTERRRTSRRWSSRLAIRRVRSKNRKIVF